MSKERGYRSGHNNIVCNPEHSINGLDLSPILQPAHTGYLLFVGIGPQNAR